MDYVTVIRQALSREVNVFDVVITAIEDYFHRQVSTISQMRERDNKKAKGDVFEALCLAWLSTSGHYAQVWTLAEFNQEYNSRLPRQDNGIDLVARTTTGWVAVQCKYRRSDRYVLWSTLSTFIGLCASTGPWETRLVMTNCRGVSHKVSRTPADRTHAIGTFRATTREHWLRICGIYYEERLPPATVPRTAEELRAARLAYYKTPQ